MHAAELSKHQTKESCWIVIDGNVYDVTSFAGLHPGGPAIILKYAGRDATEAFHEVHTIRTLEENLPIEKHLGALVGKLAVCDSAKSTKTNSVKVTELAVQKLATRVALDDFHEVAKAVLSERAYIYVSSSSNSNERMQLYKRVWSQLFFRPRVMRNVSVVEPSVSMLSFPNRYPFFIAPMGLVGAVHAEGEIALARAAARRGIHYCISTATTKSYEEIVKVFREEQQDFTSRGRSGHGELFFQLYVHSQHTVTRALLRKIQGLGFKGLFITADTPVVGKRNLDRRLQAQELIEAGLDNDRSNAGPGEKNVQGGRAPPGVLSSTLNWDDLIWIRHEWDGPIVIKGVQSAADIKIAASLGVQGVYLSNHGGRQLQDAPSSLDTLLEARTLYPGLLDKIEVFVDGGFSTGADVLKALCLGARAVGIGRPFIYAVAGYGTEGAIKVVDVLAEEIEMGMRFLGATNVDELKPELVNLPRSQIDSPRL